MEKLNTTKYLKGLVALDTAVYVEFVCLTCGLQGAFTGQGGAKESCPKCGEKVISRIQPDNPVHALV